jgi:hypothetical protein
MLVQMTVTIEAANFDQPKLLSPSARVPLVPLCDTVISVTAQLVISGCGGQARFDRDAS